MIYQQVILLVLNLHRNMLLQFLLINQVVINLLLLKSGEFRLLSHLRIPPAKNQLVLMVIFNFKFDHGEIVALEESVIVKL